MENIPARPAVAPYLVIAAKRRKETSHIFFYGERSAKFLKTFRVRAPRYWTLTVRSLAGRLY